MFHVEVSQELNWAALSKQSHPLYYFPTCYPQTCFLRTIEGSIWKGFLTLMVIRNRPLGTQVGILFVLTNFHVVTGDFSGSHTGWTTFRKKKKKKLKRWCDGGSVAEIKLTVSSKVDLLTFRTESLHIFAGSMIHWMILCNFSITQAMRTRPPPPPPPMLCSASLFDALLKGPVCKI